MSATPQGPDAPSTALRQEVDDPRVVAGLHTAIVAAHGAALVLAPAGHPLVAAVAEQLFAGADLRAVATSLAQAGFAGQPAVACICCTAGGNRVLVRGPIRAAVTSPDGAGALHDASLLATWLEVVVAPGSAVTFVPADVGTIEPGEWGPFGAGLGSARVLAIRTITPAVAPGPAPSPPPDAGEVAPAPSAGQSTPSAPLAAALRTALEAERPEPVDVSETEAPPVQAEAASDEDPSTVADAPTDEEAEAGTAAATGGDTSAVEEVAHGDYDEFSPPTLLPHTSARAEIEVPEAEPVAPPAPALDPPDISSGEPLLITAVPGMAPHPGPSPAIVQEPPPASPAEHADQPSPPTPADAPSAPGPPATASRALPDDDTGLEDVTVSLAARRAAQAAADTPRVQAVLCPAGHPNPTHGDRCRTCSAQITDRQVHTVPRPSLGRLVFADGTQVEVDRHLVLGRRPAEDPLVAGEPHELVTVPDPEDVVSRTHLVLKIDGWQLHAVDRDSTNNTFVEVPGQPPFQLRPGDAFPIPPGTTIRLGDEVAFSYDATQR